MEDGLVLIPYNFPLNTRRGVLILVVVEDGLVHPNGFLGCFETKES